MRLSNRVRFEISDFGERSKLLPNGDSLGEEGPSFTQAKELALALAISTKGARVARILRLLRLLRLPARLNHWRISQWPT